MSKEKIKTNWGRKVEITEDPYPNHARRRAKRLAELHKSVADLWPRRRKDLEEYCEKCDGPHVDAFHDQDMSTI